MHMTWIQTLILGVVEGITEFLPISSTAHLMLAGFLMGIEQTEFVKSFEIAIQLGAILAVVVIFLRRLLRNPDLWGKVAAGWVPTALVGLGLYPIIKGEWLENVGLSLVMLGLGGVVILMVEKKNRAGRGMALGGLGLAQAMGIGLCQSVAMVPGVSRAAATIIGGMAFGLSREAAVEYSFLLALPTMAAATGYDLWKTQAHFSGQEWGILLVGFGTAFVSAYVVVKWLMHYAKTQDMRAFGYYRLWLAGVWGVAALMEGVSY